MHSFGSGAQAESMRNAAHRLLGRLGCVMRPEEGLKHVYIPAGGLNHRIPRDTFNPMEDHLSCLGTIAPFCQAFLAPPELTFHNRSLPFLAPGI